MNNNAPRKKGFSVLSFLLGILFGIILVIGTVAGIVYYVLSGKVDDVLNTVGMQNKDEEGNYVYINTDKENGGVETLLELVTTLGGFLTDTDNLSVGKVEKLVPAVSGVVDGLHGMLNEYIAIDRDEFAEVRFADLGGFVQDKILDIQPAKLLDGFGMGGALDNKIISIIFNGSEAEYIEDEAGAKYPAYYDPYYYSEGNYLRVADNSPLPEGVDSANLVEKSGSLRLYYCTVDGKNYLADEDLKLLDAPSPLARIAGTEYTPSSLAKLSGNYYYKNGEKVTVTPITLRSLSDGGFDVLNDVYLTELLSSEGNDLAMKVLNGISLGSIMAGEIDFEKVLSGLPLTDLLGEVAVSDTIMVSLVYRISGVVGVSGEEHTHEGTYKQKDSSEGQTVKIYTKDGGDGKKYISRVELSTGAEVSSITVADLMDGFSVEDLMNDFTVAEFMKPDPSNGIICYLAYGIYGIDTAAKTCNIEGADKKDVKCEYSVDEDGYITSVTRLDTHENVPGTPINEISGKIAGLSEKLTLGELITIDPTNKVLYALKDCTVNNLSKGIQSLKLGDVVECEGNKMLEKLADFTIEELPTKINGLKIGDIMDIDENDKILNSIKDSTIENLPSAISNITINTLYAEEIYKITTDENGTELANPIKAEIKPATVFNEEYLYYKDINGKELVDFDKNNLGKLTSQQFAEGVSKGITYYTYGKAQGMWEMLLYVDGSEKAYKLENLTEMIGNVSSNMQNTTLLELHDAGIIKFDKREDLTDTHIKYHGEQTTLGNLQLTQALGFLVELLGREDVKAILSLMS